MIAKPVALTRALSLAVAFGFATHAAAESLPPEPLDISLEDLLRVEVTSASRKSERLHDVAAAVYVISREDIERSGATSIPEALRMAPGVDVARLANNRWAVSIRGFNNRFGNKLLVLMDGRSIYSPIFSGVLWENEDTLLEDIDRIEVIRGPGAAMWGANAVNGVINIITRRPRDTQGNLLVAGAGSEERAFASFRHGGQAGDGHYRVWGKAFDRDEAVSGDARSGNDYWRSGRVGFRGDWSVASGQRVMLSGQAYSNDTGDRWQIPDITARQGVRLTDMKQTGKGAHLLGRSEWTLNDGSEAALQAYVDYSEIEVPGAFKEERTTIDMDFQHRLLVGERHDVLWGLGYRYSGDRIGSAGFIKFQPDSRSFNLASTFIQDDITLLPNTLRMILGVRFETNNFTGYQPLPNARLMWTPSDTQSVWGSVARAVRTPSRGELDATIDVSVLPPGAPGNPSSFPILTRNVRSDDSLDNETVIAYELGYRQRLASNLSLDVAAFYNQYGDLRSAMLAARSFEFSPPPPHIVQTTTPDNSIEAHTHGVEIAVDWSPLSWWRIQPIYSYLSLNSSSTSGDQLSVANTRIFNSSDPQHQWSLRSSMSLADRQQFDFWLRYVSKLGDRNSQLAIPAYTTLDLRYAWRPTRDLELSVVGQNLLDSQHPEFVPSLLPGEALEIQRGVYLKANWQF
ncbi:MAG: Colicin I receptor precursor [Candidatus Accumulibacter appositus]|uniref:Colicin I receptor n=1 Tax=Candidatus Accumulibacter appositus TaxID=1454003 RepID=A0A011NX31_9PROT|nr:TonB-dependent receptor [Accumulibacter sp.]EXI79881.1 MAG: Colicin I receptor precursor [Candidatus Accumulibacter appositus]HRF05445.1 TonB-dependent receptor [Accumulibacter sp.]